LSNTPHVGPVPERITVTAPQVRRLIGGQFPRWAGLEVRPVARGGWDNWTFRLGAAMAVRLPSAAEDALAVGKEHRWLPVLAPQLPLPIPVPLAKGEPGADYPYSWSVCPWLDGEPARTDGIADPVRFAVDLAGCDLAIAWTLLTAEGRQVFRERLCVGEAEWPRGRGWALWKTLVTCARTLDRDDEEEAPGARRVLAAIFSVANRPW
jgi:aminoglycoside phosphotransferase (APT) family kinase protein